MEEEEGKLLLLFGINMLSDEVGVIVGDENDKAVEV
jgi:hypothetical protein